jgi:hypothetical protein
MKMVPYYRDHGHLALKPDTSLAIVVSPLLNLRVEEVDTLNVYLDA